MTRFLQCFYSSEAREIAEDRGGDKSAIEHKLRDAVRSRDARFCHGKRSISWIKRTSFNWRTPGHARVDRPHLVGDDADLPG